MLSIIKQICKEAKSDEKIVTKINGHTVTIRDAIFTEISIQVDENEERTLLNPCINNHYRLDDVLRCLREKTCINACVHKCKYGCVHCRCLKGCNLCEIKSWWDKIGIVPNNNISHWDTWWFDGHYENERIIKEQLEYEP